MNEWDSAIFVERGGWAHGTIYLSHGVIELLVRLPEHVAPSVSDSCAASVAWSMLHVSYRQIQLQIQNGQVIPHAAYFREDSGIRDAVVEAV